MFRWEVGGREAGVKKRSTGAGGQLSPSPLTRDRKARGWPDLEDGSPFLLPQARLDQPGGRTRNSALQMESFTPSIVVLASSWYGPASSRRQ